MIKGRSLYTRAIKLLVLDEVDEMPSRGFNDQIYEVYIYLPPELQDLQKEQGSVRNLGILEVTNKFITDPIKVLVKRDELTLEGIYQSILCCC
ncbi:hypothetical protein OPV22_007981 [Ensete ventricosum]|uniref:Helicase ATP-binding domain-containing protein n=1 Tax=Ensete ventricosum TaxID=4639 RepID=A0AAV8RDN5_ENSVE|nr:hypothetical protein OPV22_007981 [Ensete ventricosum]